MKVACRVMSARWQAGKLQALVSPQKHGKNKQKPSEPTFQELWEKIKGLRPPGKRPTKQSHVYNSRKVLCHLLTPTVLVSQFPSLNRDLICSHQPGRPEGPTRPSLSRVTWTHARIKVTTALKSYLEIIVVNIRKL